MKTSWNRCSSSGWAVIRHMTSHSIIPTQVCKLILRSLWSMAKRLSFTSPFCCRLISHFASFSLMTIQSPHWKIFITGIISPCSASCPRSWRLTETKLIRKSPFLQSFMHLWNEDRLTPKRVMMQAFTLAPSGEVISYHQSARRACSQQVITRMSSLQKRWWIRPSRDSFHNWMKAERLDE